MSPITTETTSKAFNIPKDDSALVSDACCIFDF